MSTSFFSRDRKLPCALALLLLLLFVAQAAYLSHRLTLEPDERALFGPAEEPQSTLLAPAARSPLVVGAARLFARSVPPAPALARLPFVLFGTLLAAAVFYIAARWYGMRGGCLVLTLCAFSPQLLATTAHAAAGIVAATGAFGLIVTSLAVAHTLYAPREVILWNWRRIALLAVSAALGLGASLAVVVLFPLALIFVFYLAPLRRRATLVIMAAALVLAAILLALIYRLHFAELAQSARSLALVAPSGPLHASSWRMVGHFLLGNGPGFALLLLSLATFAVSRKARYFGNTAALLTAVALILTALWLPHAAGFAFLALALPFLLLFVAGVSSEWLDSRWSAPFAGLLAAALVAQAYFCLIGLAQLTG